MVVLLVANRFAFNALICSCVNIDDIVDFLQAEQQYNVNQPGHVLVLESTFRFNFKSWTYRCRSCLPMHQTYKP